ncbi:alpha-keto acid decarboxylase family protein [Psychrobacillus sp. NPDC058041]|uniref:alpha-keto acid decarboxylase family protein n=1 Tax=Psychrobacillus sp. NPDC058041 TaxID=3346310 RepID=UPI0036DE94FD
MEKITLGNFLCRCLSQAGIKEVFGVAGDYNFTILDEFEKHPEITFIGNRNELNAGYSADAYARLKGIAALVTTFGVGELSACNAIAGSNSENVPVVHIVGAPPSPDQKEHKFMHHSLMDGNFRTFQKVYEPISAYTTAITLENASDEIPKALNIAQTKKKPVYIMIANDLLSKEIAVSTVELSAAVTSQTSLQQAVAHAKQLLDQSNNTVLLADVKVMRFHLEKPVQQLVETMNIPVASTVYGKGAFDETHPNYIGVYVGSCGEETVRNTVENAQCVIAVGLVWADTNTANFTAKVDFTKTIQIQPNTVIIGEAMYQNILAVDMINSLIQLNAKQSSQVNQATFSYSQTQGQTNDALLAANYYPMFQQFIKDNDVIVVETGTLQHGFSQVRLRKNVTYVTQGGWQSIGYATPAAFGVCVAAPERRVLLFTGDGSLQLTAQEISSMLEHNCKPIIFILNNGQYIVEKYLNVNTLNQKYNVIPKWDYTKLPMAFGGDAYTATVKTVEELEQAMKQAEKECHSRLCIIEIIPGDPLDAPQYLVESRKILESQKMNQ